MNADYPRQPRTAAQLTRRLRILLGACCIIALCGPRAVAQTNPLVVSTIAGLANFGSADGIDSQARFLSPTGVAVDSGGNVYVADWFNSTIRKISTNGVVTTIAGQVGIFGSANGNATNTATFTYPYGVAVDNSNNVYVADTGTNLIRKISNGTVTTIGTSATFNGPYGVAVDHGGNVYVADTGNSEIRKITPGGTVTTIAGYPTVSSPIAIAVDNATNIYVGDTNSFIRVIAPGGSMTTIGGAASPAIYYPYGIAVDSSSNVYVSDFTYSYIREITPGGTVFTLAGDYDTYGDSDGITPAGTFDGPWGVGVDSASNVYVGDYGNGNVRKITRSLNDKLSTLAGADESYGSNGPVDAVGLQARFNYPSGAATDPAGNLYVADSDNNCIRLVTPAGKVTTLAGSVNGYSGASDGTNNNAEFYYPIGICVDPATNLYVADFGNYTIREITPDATHSNWVTTTIAGQAGMYGYNNGIGTNAVFDGPYGIALDQATNLYVTDDGINKYVRFLTNSAGNWKVSTYSTWLFSIAEGIAVDSSTNVYVADAGSNQIYVIAPTGTVTPLVMTNAGLLNSPQGLVLVGSNLYVANTNNTIVGISLQNQTATVVAGFNQYSFPGSADGVGTNARFDNPTGLAVDASSNLYIADRDNNTIRKGVISTTQTVVLTVNTSPSGLPIGINGSNYSFTPQFLALTAGSTNVVTNTGPPGYAFTNWSSNGVTVSTSPGVTFVLVSNTTFVAAYTLLPPEVAVFNGATLITNGQTSAVNFGNILEGSAGTAITFTVTNAGGQALNLGTPSVPNGYTLTTNLPSTIAAGGSAPFTVQLNSGAAGTFSGQISFTNNSPASNTFTFNVTGIVTATPPNVAVFNGGTAITNGQTNVVSFGSVQQNLTGPSITFTVTNSGDLALNVGTPSVPSGFALTANLPSSIAAGASATFTVQLNTATVGIFPGQISFTNNAPGNNPFTFNITGTVLTPPEIAVFNGATAITNGQTNLVSFGGVQQNLTGPSITFTVTNSGALPLNVGTPSVPSGYTLTTNLPSSIAAGTSAAFTIKLNTATVGIFSGQVSFTNNAPGNNPFTFEITGTVITPPEVAVFNGATAITNGQTSAVSFGGVQQNLTGPSITFTVTNSGGLPLNLGTPSVPSGYTLTSNLPSTIAAGSNGIFTVQLTTSTVGTFSGQISFTNNDPNNNPFTFAITGTVITPPEIAVFNGATAITNGQPNVSFGSVQQNLAGPTITFTVTNSGGLPLNLGTPSVPSGYTLTTNLPSTIAPGTNAAFTVQLNTGTVGTFAGQISVTNNDPNNNPFTFDITGTVITPPEIAVFNGSTAITNGQTNIISFGGVQQNLTGPSITFTVTNSGGLPLNLGTPSVPSGYTLATNLPSTIAAGTNGTFTVQLNTGTVGIFSGQVSFTNNAPGNNPFTFEITGTVITPPEVAVFNGATAITNGQTSAVSFGGVQQNLTGPSITFTVTNSGGLPLNLGTPSVPSGYTLTTNLPSTIPAGSNGTFTVQLNTGVVGTFSGQISFSNNDPNNNPFAFAITGTVITPPEVAVFNGSTAITNGQTNAVSFGSGQPNLAGPSITFTVTNSGGLPLNVGTPAVPSGYTLTTNLPSTIAPGTNGTFTVQLNTGASGTFAGQISFTNNDPNNNPFTFAVTGTVIAPAELTVFNGATPITNGQSGAISFGNVEQNLIGPSITFAVTNSGGLPLNSGTPSVPSGFTLTTNLPSTIPAGSNGTFTVQLNSATVGTFSGQISFTNSDPDNNPFVFPITGTVITPPEIAVFEGDNVITNLQTTPVDFGSVQQNFAGPSITFTLTNASGLALNLGGLAVPTGFTITGNLPSSIAAGSSGTFSVQLNSGAVGTFSGLIEFTNNALGNNPFWFDITGTVLTPPEVSVFNGASVITNGQTSAVSFGSVQQNLTGPSLTFTVTNSGGVALNLGTPTVPSGFTLTTNLPPSIAPGTNATFSVELNTGTVGTFAGQIAFTNSDPTNNPFDFDITGTVLTPPEVAVFNGATAITNGQTNVVSFGGIQQNLTGPSITFTVTNSGGLPLNLGTPAVPSGYTLTTNLPSSIAPGTNAAFTVQLNTVTVGTFSGQISFTNNAPGGNPFTFDITGTVITPPEIAVFNGATVLTNGQTSAVNFGSVQQNLTGPIITFTVTNSGGLPLNVGTPSVPSGYTLTTNLPSTIAAGTNGTFTVRLNTGTVGTFSGQISFTNNAPGNNPFTFDITGTVITPPEVAVFNGATAITNGQPNVSFGSVQQNLTGPSITFTVTNSGGLPLNVGTPSVPSGYTLTTNLPSSIAAGGGAAFTVELNTGTVGTFAGQVSFTNNAPGNSPFTFGITGTVLTPPEVAVFHGATAITNGQTNAVSFGSVQQNLTGPSITFTVTNSGALPLNLGTPAVPSGYTLTTNLPASIAAGGGAAFTVQLNTGAVGTFSGQISFTNNAPGGNPFTFAVTGTVITPPEVAVFNGATAITNGQTNAVSFGTVEQNLPAPGITFTVTNSGGLPLNVGTPSVPSGYTLATNLPSTIAPGTNATFTVQLNTGTVGTFSGQVSFTNNAPGNNPFAFDITGTVITPPQIAVFNGATVITNGQTNAVSFGSVQQNLTGTIITFTVTNSSLLTLNVGTPAVPSGYTLTTNLPSSIAAGSSGTFTVRLNTGTVGTFAGQVSFTNNAPGNNPFTFDITGTVITPPEVAVFNGATAITNGQTNAVSFGSVQQNLTGPSVTFTVTNSGGLPLNVGTPSVPSGYALATNLPSSIAAGSNGTFTVQLNTTTVGTFSGPISFTNNAPGGSPFTFDITGTVITPPEVAVFHGATAITNGQTNAVSFGSVQQNLTGPAVTFTVTNSGALPLNVGTPSVPSGYTLTANLPSSIAAGSSATFTVQLDTGTVGTFSGLISFTNNAPGNNPFTFDITGMVVAPPEIAVFNGAAAITNGQTNGVSFGSVQQNLTSPSITFTVTNSGAVSLNLGTPTVPTGFTLTAGPPSSVAPGAGATFTVKLNTGTAGTFAGPVSFTNNAPGNNPFTFDITGTVVTPPEVAVFNGATAIASGQSSPVNFGSALQNSTGPSITFTVTNSGSLGLNIGTPSVPTGYTLTTSPPLSIAAGSSGTFNVQLNTATVGTFTGSVSFTNNAPGSNPFAFPVTGTVAAPSPQIEVLNGTTTITNNQTNEVNLGSVQQFQTGSPLPFTITNSGGQTLVITNITVPAGFTLDSNYSTNIVAGGAGTFSVQLTTNVLGTYSGNIVISNNSPANPFSFPITSLVTGQIISLGGNLDFGVVPVGSSGTNVFTVSNTGNTNLTVTSIEFSNAVFAANWAGGQIAAGGTQQVTVTFSPTAPTNYSGLLTVNSDKTSGADTLAISAFGANTNLLLTIITNGLGTITPNDARLLKFDQKITLKANAASGQVFSNWVGSTNSTNNPLSFSMKSNTIVQANFIQNPFIPFVGTYNGVFWATSGNVTEQTAGMLKGLAVTSKGTYSGSLSLNGASKSLSGGFGLNGQAGKTVSFGGQEGNVAVALTLTSNQPAPQVTGTISGNGWISTNLVADRATNNNQLSPSYTMLLPADTNISSPVGDGYAVVTATAGTTKTPANAKLTGFLPDGTSFSQSVSVSQDGYVPVYANLYSGKGLLLGWINLEPTNDPGAVAWVHPSGRPGLFPGGFTATNLIELSPWTNPPAASSYPTNLIVIELSSSGALQTNTYTFAVSNNFKLGGTSATAELKGSLNPKTGQLSVTFDKITANGVLILNGTNGGGYFLTKTNSGAILLPP